MTSVQIVAQGGDVVYYPSPDLGYEPTALFERLLQTVDWEQRNVRIRGVEYRQPRKVAWYGDHAYTYSGLRMEPKPWNHLLFTLCDRMSYLTGTPFNGVLLNLYKDGRDSIGMHSDDEPEFGINPTIASLSLGAMRQFDLRPKDRSLRTLRLPLEPGSVLVMAGATQTYWEHGINKTIKHAGPRINLTFRNIIYPR